MVGRTDAGAASRRRRLLLTLAAAVGAVAVVAGIVVAVGMSRGADGALPGAADMPWPAVGTAGVAVGDAQVVSPGAAQPHPMASLTKVVTALVVQDAAPIGPEDDGAVILLDAADAQFTAQEERAGGLVASLAADTRTTQRELMELMLVGSANDAARALVRHVFGREDAFLDAAAAWLEAEGLMSVVVADASGMSPESVASVPDLLRLGRLAFDDPVIGVMLGAESVRHGATAGTPGIIPHTSGLIGRFGIDAAKSGYTAQARHNLLFTAPLDGDGRIVGVVLGAPSAAQRDTDAARILSHVRAAAG